MLLGIGLFQFMSSLWINNVTPLPAGERLIDVNGTALVLNQTVKLVGRIVSLNSTAPHFDGVGVMLIHPNGVGPLVGETFFVDPQQVVVGS